MPDDDSTEMPDAIRRMLPAILIDHLRDEDKPPEDDEEEMPIPHRYAVIPVTSALPTSQTGYTGVPLQIPRGDGVENLIIRAGMPVVTDETGCYSLRLAYTSDDPRMPQEMLDAMTVVFRPLFRVDIAQFRPLPITAGLTIPEGDRKRGEFSYTCHLDMTAKGRPCGMLTTPTETIVAMQRGEETLVDLEPGGTFFLVPSNPLHSTNNGQPAPVMFKVWEVTSTRERHYYPNLPNDIYCRYRNEAWMDILNAAGQVIDQQWGIASYFSTESTVPGSWSFTATFENRGIVPNDLRFQRDMWGDNIDLRTTRNLDAWIERGLATGQYDHWPRDMEYDLKDPADFYFGISRSTPWDTLQANDEYTRSSVTNDAGNENNYLAVPSEKPTTPTGSPDEAAQNQLVGVTLQSSRGQKVYCDGSTTTITANGSGKTFSELTVTTDGDRRHVEIDWQWATYAFSRTDHYFVADRCTIDGTSVIFPIVDPGMVSHINFYCRPRRTTAAKNLVQLLHPGGLLREAVFHRTARP